MADIAEEYRSSLSELNFNSKPHINMLTMLAEENAAHAAVIVQTIVDHINSVTPDVKLPSLYLVDSIVKNIGKVYIQLFSKHLVSLFTSVFEKVDENIRSLLYKLRSTWTGIFPNTVLLQLDRTVVTLDPAWPILAKPQIHFNPKFLKEKTPVQLPPREEPSPAPQNILTQEVEMKKRELLLLQALHQKKKELITLQLKAALASPTTTDSIKEDTKKIVNVRDPRLSKKANIASTTSDSTVLQSVVIVPKGMTNKRNEQDPLAVATKKVKVDSVASHKKDMKTKPNSGEFENKSNLNIELNAQNNSCKPIKDQKSERNKKQPFDAEVSCESIDKLPLQSNMDFLKDTSHKNVNSVPERSNEFIKNNFVPNTSVTEENKYIFKPQPVMMTNEDTFHKNIQKLDPPPAPPLFLGNEDKDYRMLHKTANERSVNESAYSKRPAVPVVKTFILDKKERKVYFVNNRSFAFMDDNIPKELTFEGPAKLVFIEGLSQPIKLSFGEEVKFDTDGKCNYIKFGTPSREVYINDYPYEAQFGGPSFTAMLSDGKIHRIHISGPPPHVVLSESPSYELYEQFCLYNKEFLHRFDNEPSINNDNLSTNDSVGTKDVDMRMNNIKFSSTFFSFPLERMQDLDWQRIHVNNMKQTEWNVPKNSFESFKDNEPNYTASVNFSQSPEWGNSQSLSKSQAAPIQPPPLPPKQIINRFPLPPPTYRNIDGNSPLISINQYSMNEHTRLLPPCTMEQAPFTISSIEQHRFFPPSNTPLSQPNVIGNEYNVNRLDLNLVKNSNIPRLSPPPLPPFIGSVQSTSGIQTVLSTSTSAPCNNSISSVPLPLPAVSTPLLTLPPLQPMPRLSAPLPVSLPITTHVSTYTVSENVPKFNAVSSSSASTTTVPTNDMQLFMEKLKAAGLIKSDLSASVPVSTSSTTTSEPEKKDDKKDELLKEETIPEITFESKCLKKFHSGVIAVIYSGSQCATCGMRFKEIQSEQYSRHLDWHFRRNRREKDGAKKPFSRRWFYEIKDWIQFKEFEDVDERAPSYFELQANTEQIEEEPENICSVSCSECDSENCAVCGEQFTLFWVEEEEEWHLRNAVKHENQVYHPACYEDFKKANEPVAESLADDSTIDIKLSEESLNCDVKIKTEVMDIDENIKSEVTDVSINIKTEMMDIDPEPKKETMDVNDNVVKSDTVPVIMSKDVDSDANDKTNELKAEEKLDKSLLVFKEEEMQVDEQTQNKEVESNISKTEKEVKRKGGKTDDMSQKLSEENCGGKVEENNIESVTTESVKEPNKVKKESIDSMMTECEKEFLEIKKELVETNETETSSDNSKKDIASSETDTNGTVSDETKEKTESSSHPEIVPVKSEDDLEDIEFRPPTPDPRFEVLPPVSRGTEISNLCIIM